MAAPLTGCCDRRADQTDPFPPFPGQAAETFMGGAVRAALIVVTVGHGDPQRNVTFGAIACVSCAPLPRSISSKEDARRPGPGHARAACS